MKVVISSILSIIFSILFCIYYIVPNIIKHVEIDSLIKLIVAKKLCKTNHEKAEVYLTNEINNTIWIITSDNLMNIKGVIYLMKNSPKERVYSSEILKKGLDKNLSEKLFQYYNR